MESASSETQVAEELTTKSNETLKKLDSDMKDVRVEYLGISENARNAYEAAEKAVQQAAFTEVASEKLKVKIEEQSICYQLLFIKCL